MDVLRSLNMSPKWWSVTTCDCLTSHLNTTQNIIGSKKYIWREFVWCLSDTLTEKWPLSFLLVLHQHFLKARASLFCALEEQRVFLLFVLQLSGYLYNWLWIQLCLKLHYLHYIYFSLPLLWHFLSAFEMLLYKTQIFCLITRRSFHHISRYSLN